MIQSNVQNKRTLIIGYNGGVARAFLALLTTTPTGKDLLKTNDRLFLLDQMDSDYHPTIDRLTILEPQKITSGEDLANLIQTHRLTDIIDLSSTDTVDCTRVCDELGVNFLCTSVEEWPEKGSIPTDQAIARLLPPHRDELPNSSHLVGSGANPGIVNALVDRAITEFARRKNTDPSVEALKLRSILITEKDTTAEKNADYNNTVFPMTWSPEHCLEELFEPRAFFAKSGKIYDLNHIPTQQTYRARCGNEMIEGMAVPHEETKTLARKYSNVEIAFLYEIPLAARRALASRPNKLEISDWNMRRLFPPTTAEISGYDRVGVLLTSEIYGEMWIGFETSVNKALPLGSNATQLQVAAGVLAGWKQLGKKKGIHFVEDLDTEEFLKVSEEVLGPSLIVFDEKAKALSLEDRTVAQEAEALLEA